MPHCSPSLLNSYNESNSDSEVVPTYAALSYSHIYMIIMLHGVSYLNRTKIKYKTRWFNSTIEAAGPRVLYSKYAAATPPICEF